MEHVEGTALETRRTGDRAALCWSERGEIACATHAPFPGSDTWIWERWSPMTEAERREWARLLGHPPQCEVCPEERTDD
jgi:hypothetical protein